MIELPSWNILLLIDDPALAKLAQGLEATVWRNRNEIPAGAVPDLIITDRHDAPSEDFDAGMISLAAKIPADVVLPADTTPRELSLACRLLGEVVWLRRQRRTGMQEREVLADMAMRDPLTDLPNRRAWDREFRARFEAACPERPFCLAIVDLDLFKTINDRHGYVAGDAAIRAAAAALRDAVRNHDFVARLGGDEFGLLLADLPETHARPIVDRIRTTVHQHLADHGESVMTVSAGLATCTGEGAGEPSQAALFEAADAALRTAKREGRNRTVAAPAAAPSE